MLYFKQVRKRLSPQDLSLVREVALAANPAANHPVDIMPANQAVVKTQKLTTYNRHLKII